MNGSNAPARVVYCLTSDGADLYAAMTQVSAATLRFSHPGAEIRVVLDPASAAALRQMRHGLLELVDGLEVREVPAGLSATARNRWLKTQLRLLLSGPFLFLDSDTVVRGPIDALIPDGLNADLAAAANNSRDLHSEQIWDEDRQALETLGWLEPLNPNLEANPWPYCNGGVLGYADSPGAAAFARCWHGLWQEGLERLGRPRDQPALNTALRRSGARLQVLPHRCNAQYKANPAVWPQALIWHSYASFGESPLTLFLAAALRLQHGAVLSPRLVRRLVRNWHPWMRNRPGHDWIVRRALRRAQQQSLQQSQQQSLRQPQLKSQQDVGGFSRREQLWLGGMYRQALAPGRD